LISTAPLGTITPNTFQNAFFLPRPEAKNCSKGWQR